MNPFTRTEYQNETFQDLDGHRLQVAGIQFQDCVFKGCNLGESQFRNCSFDHCRFENCDLSLARLPYARFEETSFKGCRLIGINWCTVNWDRKSLLIKKRVDFSNCYLDHGIFINLDLKNTAFTECHAHHLDFEGANLSQADFSGSDLEMSRIVGCDLAEAISSAHRTTRSTLLKTPCTRRASPCRKPSPCSTAWTSSSKSNNPAFPLFKSLILI